MKKITISALAACMVLCFALPTMAGVDVDFSGSLRADGIYNDNTSLTSGDKVAEAYQQGRFRLKSVFKVNDNISITTQFDALERKWGTSDDPSVNADGNVDFEWAYATMKTPVGGFLFGRMSGNAWGTLWLDDEGPRDRIVYVLPLDKWIFAAVGENFSERDSVAGVSSTQSDDDLTKYYLTATYKADNYTAGLLYGLYDYKTFQDLYQSASGNIVAIALGGGPTTTGGIAHVFSPYFDGKFGPIGIKAEASWATAKAKYDSAWWTSASGAPAANTGGSDEKTVDILSYMVDLNYYMGPFSIGGGYARAQGDANWNDDKFTSQGVFSQGADWEKTLILFSSLVGTESTLGGQGAPVGSTVNASYYGYQVFFLQADFDLNESINIGAVYANSKADEVPATWDDKHGSEIDVKATWKFLDNVTWTNIAAFLNAGDFYKAGGTGDISDTYALFSRIVIDF